MLCLNNFTLYYSLTSDELITFLNVISQSGPHLYDLLRLCRSQGCRAMFLIFYITSTSFCLQLQLMLCLQKHLEVPKVNHGKIKMGIKPRVIYIISVKHLPQSRL